VVEKEKAGQAASITIKFRKFRKFRAVQVPVKQKSPAAQRGGRGLGVGIFKDEMRSKSASIAGRGRAGGGGGGGMRRW
jgi:hypothetical protein